MKKRTALHAELDTLMAIAIKAENLYPSKDFPETFALIKILNKQEAKK